MIPSRLKIFPAFAAGAVAFFLFVGCGESMEDSPPPKKETAPAQVKKFPREKVKRLREESAKWRAQLNEWRRIAYEEDLKNATEVSATFPLKTKKSFSRLFVLSDEIIAKPSLLDAEAPRDSVILNQEQAKQLAGYLKDIEKSTVKIDRRPLPPRQSPQITAKDPFIGSFTFKKKGKILSRLLYFSHGKVETPEGKVWFLKDFSEFEKWMLQVKMPNPLNWKHVRPKKWPGEEKFIRPEGIPAPLR